MDYSWSQNQDSDLRAFGSSVLVLSEMKLKFHISGFLHFLNIPFSYNKRQYTRSLFLPTVRSIENKPKSKTHRKKKFS